jgi:hypothetical protein
MWRPNQRVRFGLGILALGAAATAAALLAFASGGNAASSKACVQQLNPAQANCLFVAVVPNVLSANKTGLVVVRFKNIFANATATHTVLAATMPSGASVSSVSASTGVTCSQATVSCPIGSVPGGSIVSMYVQFTTTLSAPSTLGAVKGFVSFDEANQNTGTTTNDTFETDSGQTPIVGAISNAGQGADQGGLCTNDLAQTGFTTNLNGQQTNVSDLPQPAQGGLPCTPVSAGARPATADENSACGGSCATPVSFVFFPVLNNNATATVAVILPTLPAGVSAWQKTPLFEILGTGSSQTRVQLVNCGVVPNPSPDTCITNLAKFGSKGVQFTLSVAGSPFDGRYTG